MPLSVDLQGLGKWELIYYASHQQDEQKNRIEVDIPILLDKHILAVGVSSSTAKPTWYRSGNLIQVLQQIELDDGVIFPGSGSPSNTLDASRRLIVLHSIQLVIFPKVTPTYSLWFQAVPWLKSLNLGIWSYTGAQSDTTEEMVELARVDLLRIESKVDEIKGMI